jgi:hypothetical protein
MFSCSVIETFSGINGLSFSNMTRANVHDSCAACTSCNDNYETARSDMTDGPRPFHPPDRPD